MRKVVRGCGEILGLGKSVPTDLKAWDDEGPGNYLWRRMCVRVLALEVWLVSAQLDITSLHFSAEH